MASNLAVGDRVVFVNARTQTAELGTVLALNDRLPDGTLIATVQRDAGGTLQVPIAALNRAS